MTIHSTNTTVLVEDFRLKALVGQHTSERDHPQTVSVNITCSLLNPEVAGDDLGNTFDYVPIVENVKALAMNRSRALIETFAEEIAEACFSNTRVERTTISVRKMNKLPAVAAVGTIRTFERN